MKHRTRIIANLLFDIAFITYFVYTVDRPGHGKVTALVRKNGLRPFRRLVTRRHVPVLRIDARLTPERNEIAAIHDLLAMIHLHSAGERFVQ